MPQSHKKEELRMKNKMKKWKVIGVLLVFLFGAAGFAYADVSIDSSNYTWEQNSYRPLRINYVTGTSYQILGFDAHLQYNNYDGFANLGVPTMSNEIPTTVLEGVDRIYPQILLLRATLYTQGILRKPSIGRPVQELFPCMICNFWYRLRLSSGPTTLSIGIPQALNF